MRFPPRFCVLPGALVLLCAGAFGQTAQITGLITDPNGAAAPEATVTARNVDTDIRTETVTNTRAITRCPV